MSQNEPPDQTPNGVEPPAVPAAGAPPSGPLPGDSPAPAASQPIWPDTAAGVPSSGAPPSQAGEASATPNAAGGVPAGTTSTTPPEGWAAASPARRSGPLRLLPRLIIPGIIVVVVVVGFLFRDRISGNASELKPGDCFDDPITAGSSVAEIDEVQHHPCSEPHLYEVVETVKFPGSGDTAFPGQSAFTSFIVEKCSVAFTGYIGIAEEQSTLTYLAYTPVESGWKKGDRDITCFLGTIDGSQLTGSMKDSRR